MTEVLEKTNNVVARTLRRSGAVVSYKLPATLKEGTVPTDGVRTEVNFLQFATFIRGKAMNFFVHGGEKSLAGSEVRARVEIWEKQFTDGRCFVHVDLHVVDADTLVTHELFVRDAGLSPSRDWEIFQTKDLPIFIALSEYDEAAKMAGSDTQLARLLREGWRIAKFHSDSVDLTRNSKNGTLKSMTHKRPNHRAT